MTAMLAGHASGSCCLSFLAVSFDYVLCPDWLLVQWHHGDHQSLKALIYDGALFMSLPAKRLAA